MIFELINLEIKQLFRSAGLAKNVLVNVLIGFIILYLFVQLLVIGFSLPRIIQSITENSDAFSVVNTYLAHFFVFEFVMRYFVQKVPGANIAPLLHLPIKKSLLTFYLLGKSLISPYSLLVLCLFGPFVLRVVAPVHGGVAGLQWLGTLLMISWCLHWWVIMYKLKSDTGFKGFIIFLLPLFLIFVADHFGWLSMLTGLKPWFTMASENIIPILVTFLIMALSFTVVFRMYKQHAHIENDTKNAQYKFYNYTPGILSRFGSLGEIASLEWRLIIRYKKGRTYLFTSALFLLYGFAFYTNPQHFHDDGSVSAFLLLPALFITGMFGMNFGQLFLSWNTPHFDFYMNQPGGISQLIRGKYLLYVVMIVIMLFLSLPYVYFGKQILYLHFAAFLFNIGINLHVIVWFALWQPKPMNLNAGGTWNMEGLGCAQFFMIVPVMGIPFTIILVLSAIFNQTVALFAMAGFGLLGLMAFPFFTGLAVSRVLENRYNISSTFRKES